MSHEIYLVYSKTICHLISNVTNHERRQQMKVFTSVCTSIILCTILGSNLFGQGHSDLIEISIADSMQGFAQVEYDPDLDEYLVVWEDQRNGSHNTDIYGQFVKGDGTLKGNNFAICAAEGHQYWPRLAFAPKLDRYLVVFEDHRVPTNADIRGILVKSDGSFLDAPTSEADQTFGICTNDSMIYTCSVAYNYKMGIFLVVWGDYRNDQEGNSWTGADVFGQLVEADGTLLNPPQPPDPKVNFGIGTNPEYFESVADVTYNPITNEFFVVYGTSIGYVMGQRVNHLGQLIDQNGNTGLTKPCMFPSPFLLSWLFMNGPDCLQARVASRTEFGITPLDKAMAETYTEVQTIWKGMLETKMDNDVYGQRVGFFWEEVDKKWVAKYIDINGDVQSDVANDSVSIQDGWVGPPDLAYGAQDDEYLVAWGDPRNGGWPRPPDLYGQRLWINEAEDMIFLDDDRVNTVTHLENIPIDTNTLDYEGSLLGVAHSSKRNEFLLAFTYEDTSLHRDSDIYAHRFYGTEPEPTDVAFNQVQGVPTQFTVFQNYPNPFNPSTTIRFTLPQPALVKLSIFNTVGQEVARLMYDDIGTGEYDVVWNGSEYSSGLYLCRIEAASHGFHVIKMQKMILQK